MDDIIQQVRQGELYSLLSFCTKENLSPLVEIILSKKITNLLDINDDYKAHKPDHTRYHKLIGDEIRLFGGNSIKNAYRGGEGPPYSEIVVDVCKKLGVPFVNGDTIKNEGNLLDIFIEQRWQSLDAAEREKFATEARKAATEKNSTVKAFGKSAIPFVITRLALGGPAGLALLGLNMLDASFKITIPSVLHIAYLRRRIIEQWTEWESNSKVSYLGSEVQEQSVQSAAFVIAGEDGEPVLSLARIPEPRLSTGWHQIDRSDDGISRLNPLLAAVPSLSVAREVATTKYMEVVCSLPLALAADGDGNRGWSVVNNKIKEHAKLFDPDKLTEMVNISALMNVASIALAQKHLADISKKLSEIKEAIDGIRKFQHDERRSKLTGSIRYLEQVAPAILAGERPDRVLYQIEHHEAELIQVHDHLLEDIRTELELVGKIKDKEWFGSKKAKADIEMHQQRIVDLFRELLLCLRARSCGWQLLCLFQGEEIGKRLRRQDIQKSLDKLAIDGEVLKESDSLFRKKIHELSSSNELKLVMLNANETLLADVAACRVSVQADLRAADEMLAALQKPVKLAARVENGRIAAIMAL